MTSERVFAGREGMVYILGYDKGNEGSVIVRGCVMLVRVKGGGTWVEQNGKRFVLNKGIVKIYVESLLCLTGYHKEPSTRWL